MLTKRVSTIILTTTLLASPALANSPSSPNKVVSQVQTTTTILVNGKPVKMNVVIKNGNSLVSVKELAEALNLEISYDKKAKTIALSDSYNVYQYGYDSLIIDLNENTISGVEVTGQTSIDNIAVINGTTYIPLRPIIDSLYCYDINFDNNKINIQRSTHFEKLPLVNELTDLELIAFIVDEIMYMSKIVTAMSEGGEQFYVYNERLCSEIGVYKDVIVPEFRRFNKGTTEYSIYENANKIFEQLSIFSDYEYFSRKMISNEIEKVKKLEKEVEKLEQDFLLLSKGKSVLELAEKGRTLLTQYEYVRYAFVEDEDDLKFRTQKGSNFTEEILGFDLYDYANMIFENLEGAGKYLISQGITPHAGDPSGFLAKTDNGVEITVGVGPKIKYDTNYNPIKEYYTVTHFTAILPQRNITLKQAAELCGAQGTQWMSFDKNTNYYYYTTKVDDVMIKYNFSGESLLNPNSLVESITLQVRNPFQE